jgi:hypothetical protein
MQITVDLTDDEQAAVDAEVARLAEDGLTAEGLVGRMAHKVVRGWAAQRSSHRTSELRRVIAEAIAVADDRAKTEALTALGLEERADGQIARSR